MNADHTTPKRRGLRRSENGPRDSLDNNTHEGLTSGEALSSESIYAALRLLQCAVGAGLEVIDPDAPESFSTLVGDTGTKRLVPLCHEGHWVLGVLVAHQGPLRVYDPQPSPTNRQAFKARIAVLFSATPPQVRFTAPLLQEADEDSGLLLVVSAFYVSLNMQVPQEVDHDLWRELLRILLMPLSDKDADIVQNHVLGQPLILESRPEEVAMPGHSINVGDIPVSLEPTEAWKLLDHLRRESLAAFQRTELILYSVSSAMEVVTALESRARTRCEQEIGQIGVGVVGAVIRLHRLKSSFEKTQHHINSAHASLASIIGRLAITDE